MKRLKSYQAGRSISEVKRELGLKKVIKLASNESPYPPVANIISALEEKLSLVNRYPGEGALLKQKLATLLRVSPENLLLGHGSNEIIRLFAQTVLNPGEEVIVPVPSFALYPRIVEIFEGRVIKVPLSGHRLDLKATKAAISDKTKVIFICNPNNPTGTIVKRDEIEVFLKSVPQNVLVIFDEAYFEFVDDPNYSDSLGYFRPAISAAREGVKVAVLRTFSKIYSLAGLRIGYAIAPSELVSVANNIRDPHNVNSLAQAAALAALDSPEEIEQRKRLNKEGKEFFYREFEGLRLSYVPSQTNFVWLDVGRDSREVFRALLKEGVIVRTGEVFGEGCENFVRVTVGKPDENQTFVEALRKVLKS